MLLDVKEDQNIFFQRHVLPIPFRSQISWCELTLERSQQSWVLQIVYLYYESRCLSVRPFVCPSVRTHTTSTFFIQTEQQTYFQNPCIKAEVLKLCYSDSNQNCGKNFKLTIFQFYVLIIPSHPSRSDSVYMYEHLLHPHFSCYLNKRHIFEIFALN